MTQLLGSPIRSIRRRIRPGGTAENASRVQLNRTMETFAAQTPAGRLVLDAGAGTGPYRPLFDHARYEASDFAQLSTKYTPLDYVCDLTAIPVEDGRFDAVVCNQVLEHVPAPDLVLAELSRVLTPGGRILLSVPLFYAEHQQPYDFFRYTQFALRKLFVDAGFEVDSIDWLEGYYGTVAYQFLEMSRELPRDLGAFRAWDPGWRGARAALVVIATKLMAGILQGFYTKLDLDWKYTQRGMPKNYVVLAHKPAD